MTSRPSIKTVAAAAGVSPATVSNAYNRPDQLSAQLRERILSAAAQLGYRGETWPKPYLAGRDQLHRLNTKDTKDTKVANPHTYS